MKRKLKPLRQDDYEMEIIEDLGGDKYNPRSAIFECTNCYKHEKKRVYNVKTKRLKYCTSCANHFAQLKHDDSHTRLYKIYHGIKSRCLNESSTGYENYGGRGVKLLFLSYEEFKKWSYDNGYIEGLSIDRKNNDGHYEKTNCRWTTPSVQVANRRKQKRNKSGYIGVVKRLDRSDYYSVTLSFKNKVLFSKYGKNPLELAKARDMFIIKHELPHTLNF